jgi:hypothetical protein
MPPVRRAAVVLTIVAGLVAGAPVGAAPPVQPITPYGGGLSASLSSAKASAKPVVLTLKLVAELVCGRLGTPLVVALPAAASLPAHLTPTAVLVDGKPAATVAVAANRVTITETEPGGVMCYVVAPGLVTLRFTRSAALGNPGTPGSYTIAVQHGRSTYRTAVHISA